MSSYFITRKHKATGEMHQIICLDDYFGRHVYGYIPPELKEGAYTYDQLEQEYEMESE